MTLLIPFFQVDAFTDTPFAGNPAAVCILDPKHELNSATMQAIAAENNLSETAFVSPIVASPNCWQLRWFSPNKEVSLCGHATLAAAHVLFKEVHPYNHHQQGNTATFITAKHRLSVTNDNARCAYYHMQFPALTQLPVTDPLILSTLTQALNSPILAAFKGEDDYCVLLTSHQDIVQLQPNLTVIQQLAARGIIATARADSIGVDFVSRCFYPLYGINEDPVTGSAHCQLAPYWADVLGKTQLVAMQLSARTGRLDIVYTADTSTVSLSGTAITVIQGQWRL